MNRCDICGLQSDEARCPICVANNSQPDYEPSVCPNCGNDAHTEAELNHCMEMLMYRGECGVCGESFGARDSIAEMFWPGRMDDNPLPDCHDHDGNLVRDNIICHADCGISLGLAIA